MWAFMYQKSDKPERMEKENDRLEMIMTEYWKELNTSFDYLDSIKTNEPFSRLYELNKEHLTKDYMHPIRKPDTVVEPSKTLPDVIGEKNKEQENKEQENKGEEKKTLYPPQSKEQANQEAANKEVATKTVVNKNATNKATNNTSSAAPMPPVIGTPSAPSESTQPPAKNTLPANNTSAVAPMPPVIGTPSAPSESTQPPAKNPLPATIPSTTPN
jgi:hypothetical protein